MTPETYEVFDKIVLEGALRYGGMASFADVLDAEGAHAIRAFLAAGQRQLGRAQGSPLTAGRH